MDSNSSQPPTDTYFIPPVPIIHKIPTSSILSKRSSSHELPDGTSKKIHQEQIVSEIPSQLINIVPSSDVLVPTIIISPKPLTREELDRVVQSTKNNQNGIPLTSQVSNLDSFTQFGAQAIRSYSPIHPLLANNNIMFNDPNKQNNTVNSIGNPSIQTHQSPIQQGTGSPMLHNNQEKEILTSNQSHSPNIETKNIGPINLNLIQQLSSLSKADEILVIPLKPESLYNEAHLPVYPLMIIPEVGKQDKEKEVPVGNAEASSNQGLSSSPSKKLPKRRNDTIIKTK